MAEHDSCRLVAVYDEARDAAEAVAAASAASVLESWQQLVENADIDAVVVSTSHDALAPLSVAALTAGKHVLCEKPLGRNPEDVHQVLEAARTAGRCVAAGYNHRYYPAVKGIRDAMKDGRLGPIDFIRGRYGHGGRPGYDREWRADAERAGGGELLDQGAHLVDLCLWLLGEFESVTGYTATRFWDIAPLEDNAFGLFRAPGGEIASIHVSWTQWKNLFSLEVFGRDGYAVAQGRGGSYGTQRLVLGKRLEEGGAPEEELKEFGDRDESWSREWGAFVETVEADAPCQRGAEEALQTMEWIWRLYTAAKQSRVVGRDESPQ